MEWHSMDWHSALTCIRQLKPHTACGGDYAMEKVDVESKLLLLLGCLPQSTRALLLGMLSFRATGQGLRASERSSSQGD
eukprot:5137017-Amphidinium_carterae.1